MVASRKLISNAIDGCEGLQCLEFAVDWFRLEAVPLQVVDQGAFLPFDLLRNICVIDMPSAERRRSRRFLLTKDAIARR